MRFTAWIPATQCAAFLFICFIPFYAPATPTTGESLSQATSLTQSSAPTHRRADLSDDTWFFYIGTGLGQASYDQTIQDRIDYQKNVHAGSAPQAGFFDLPGVYRKLRDGLALGVILNWSMEHYANNWRDSNSFAVHTYNSAFSALYFPGQVMGQGWFLRGDLGYSRILQIREYSAVNADGERYDRINSDALFTQAGIGYGWRAGDLARLLIHLNAFRSSGEVHHVSGFGLNVGFLL